MSAGFEIVVSAATVVDAVAAYGRLHAKTSGGRHMHLYLLRAIHAGAFAAVWMACGVDITVVAAAAALATTGRELADMTLPADCATRCTNRVQIISARGNYWANEGMWVKQHYGSRRDVVDALSDTTTLPSLGSFLMAPCSEMRMSAAAVPAPLRALVGPTTEWDVRTSLPSTAPVCFSALSGVSVEETIGRFYLSLAE